MNSFAQDLVIQWVLLSFSFQLTRQCSFFLAGGWIIGNSFSEAGREWNAKVEIERYVNGGGVRLEKQLQFVWP